jgi:hypothetical protein
MIPLSDLWMLGLRPVRTGEGEGESPPSDIAPRPARSCKYVVAERLGRWRVQCDDEDAGAFASLADAVGFACDRARREATAGVLGVVVVQSEVQEMHCFTPPADAYDATPRPGLRLVGDAGR